MSVTFQALDWKTVPGRLEFIYEFGNYSGWHCYFLPVDRPAVKLVTSRMAGTSLPTIWTSSFGGSMSVADAKQLLRLGRAAGVPCDPQADIHPNWRDLRAAGYPWEITNLAIAAITSAWPRDGGLLVRPEDMLSAASALTGAIYRLVHQAQADRKQQDTERALLVVDPPSWPYSQATGGGAERRTVELLSALLLSAGASSGTAARGGWAGLPVVKALTARDPFYITATGATLEMPLKLAEGAKALLEHVNTTVLAGINAAYAEGHRNGAALLKGLASGEVLLSDLAAPDVRAAREVQT
jgi:hypothetical protein